MLWYSLIVLGILFAPTLIVWSFLVCSNILYEISQDPIFRIPEPSNLVFLMLPGLGHIIIPFMIFLFFLQLFLIVLCKLGLFTFKIPYRLISKNGLVVNCARFVYRTIGSICTYEF